MRAGTKATFRSLHTRNFRLFFAGQMVSQVGNWLTMVAQTLLVLHLTDNGLAIGVLAACQFAPVLLVGAWAGLVADRSDKRKLLLIVQCLAMVQSFVLAALAFSGSPPVWAIYLVALAGGFATAFDNPARRAIVVEMVDEDDVQNAISLNSALMTSSRIFGPALAGLLVHTVGYGWCFSVDGISYLAVIAGLWWMDPTKIRRPPVTRRQKGQIREGFRYVRGIPELWVPLVMMAMIGTFAYNFQVVLPLFVERTFTGDDGTFTLLYSVISVGSLVGALATARRTTISLRDLVVAATVFGIAMVLLAASPSLGASFPVAVFVGLGSIVFMTTSTAIVQIRTDPAMRGRVLALQAMVFLGSTPIGGPIMGAICDQWGARAGLGVGAGSCFAAAAYGMASRSRADRAGRELAAAADAVTRGVELEPA